MRRSLPWLRQRSYGSINCLIHRQAVSTNAPGVHHLGKVREQRSGHSRYPYSGGIFVQRMENVSMKAADDGTTSPRCRAMGSALAAFRGVSSGSFFQAPLRVSIASLLVQQSISVQLFDGLWIHSIGPLSSRRRMNRSLCKKTYAHFP